MSQEIYKRYRPKTLKEVVGQAEAVKVLEDFIKRKDVPHAIMFMGPSGTGKTSLARILRKELKCSNHDFQEINAAESRGIDTIREINRDMRMCPMNGECRVWLLDECQALAPYAQQSLLKMLEDTPNHCYFFLATTHPEKLLPTIRTRCTKIKVNFLSSECMEKLVVSIAKKEKKQLSQEVVSRIIEVSEGSAREALVALGSVVGLDDEEQQLKIVLSSESKKQSVELCRVLLNPRSQWKEVASILKNLEEEPEQLRRMILGYCSTVLLAGGKLAERAYAIICSCECNLYDSGKAGLIAACYRVMANG